MSRIGGLHAQLMSSAEGAPMSMLTADVKMAEESIGGGGVRLLPAFDQYVRP